MTSISVTRLRLRSIRFFLPFLWHTRASIRQAKRAEGNLGVALRRYNDACWTLTVWRDLQAMRDFMMAGAHRTAMPHLITWCDEASVAYWETDNATLPTWDVAEQRLATEGRMSRVKFPSPAHAAGKTLGS